MADGHLNKCKDCARADTAKRSAYYAQFSLWAEKEAERQRLKQEKRRQRGLAFISREQKREAQRRYRAKYPEKAKALQVLHRALRAGLIIRQPCSVCGKKAQAHHDDYSKPLEVVWLCSTHHANHHVLLRQS